MAAPFPTLPPELALRILSFLDPRGLCMFRAVSRGALAFASDNALWKALVARLDPDVCRRGLRDGEPSWMALYRRTVRSTAFLSRPSCTCCSRPFGRVYGHFTDFREAAMSVHAMSVYAMSVHAMSVHGLPRSMGGSIETVTDPATGRVTHTGSATLSIPCSHCRDGDMDVTTKATLVADGVTDLRVVALFWRGYGALKSCDF